jgi:hypothetical protein
VFCDVYQLRSEAGKLPREAALATRREAWLELGRPRSGAPESIASLRDARGVELDNLSCASVRFIRGGGLMIRGFQTIIYPGPTRFFNQAWWCVPKGTPAPLPIADQQLAPLAAAAA